jgi:hypothetical protein
LAGALSAAADDLEAPVIELIFRVAPHSRKTMARRGLDFLKEIVGMQTIQSTLEGAEVLKAKGVDKRTGRIEAFDFLKDKMVFVRAVAKENERDRSINSTDMFQQIEAAYNENKETVHHAVGISS